MESYEEVQRKPKREVLNLVFIIVGISILMAIVGGCGKKNGTGTETQASGYNASRLTIVKSAMKKEFLFGM